MTPSLRALPDDAAVVAAVATLVAGAAERGAVTLVSRRSNAYSSSSPSEIVALDVPGAGRCELFLKYDREASDPEPRCRHGLAYCEAVYERIVRRLPPPHVPCLGLVAIGSPPISALVLEHLSEALRVNETPDESGVIAAAEWCGRLHAWGATRIDEPALAFLARHDIAYYRAWATRARTLAAVGPVPPWLVRLCGDFTDRAAALAAAERTIIHGEFGPQNVLWKDGVVHPIDWESAAVGPGAIDMATLFFGWPDDVVRRGIDAYWRSRGVPAAPDFAEAFRLATVYTALRWLPVPESRDDPGWHRALARLESVAALTRAR